jgi:thioredoxin 2
MILRDGEVWSASHSEERDDKGQGLDLAVRNAHLIWDANHELPMIFPCPACDRANSLSVREDAKSATCTTCKAPLFGGHPIHLTVEKFNAHIIEDSPPLLIDFWADWCGPCKTMAPIFESLVAEFEPHVRFAKVNTDEQRQIAEYFNIQTIPTLSFIHRQR